MARLHPPLFPAELSKPALAGERAIWQALLAAPIPDHVHLFYNRRPPGSHRAPDVLWLDAMRGVIVIEVKGGLVHFSRRGFRQKLKTHRKRIDPWRQASRALLDLFTALGIEGVPHAVILAVPVMRRSAFTFGASPHILTADDLAPPALVAKIEALLPPLPPAEQCRLAPAFESILRALSRKGE